MKVASPIYFSCIILELTPTLSFGNGIYLRVLHVLKSEIYMCSENAELQDGSVPPSWVHLNCGSLSHGECGDLNDNVTHGLGWLNTWSPIASAVCVCVGGVVLLESLYWKQILRFPSYPSLPVPSFNLLIEV